MDNQHRKIKGYRELNQTEIDLMNKIKALGPEIENVLVEIEEHIKTQNKEGESDKIVALRLHQSTAYRFLSLAKTEFQTGLMYATRAVAQPEFF